MDDKLKNNESVTSEVTDSTLNNLEDLIKVLAEENELKAKELEQKEKELEQQKSVDELTTEIEQQVDQQYKDLLEKQNTLLNEVQQSIDGLQTSFDEQNKIIVEGDLMITIAIAVVLGIYMLFNQLSKT